MRYIFFLLFIYLTGNTGITAQTIDINLPYHSNRDLLVTLCYGTDRDTIFHAPLDDKGNARIVIPEKNKGFRGVASLKTGRRNATYDFIIAGENFTLSCKDEFLLEDNVQFTGSVENESFKQWFREQNKRRGKLTELGNTLFQYTPDDSFYIPLQREKQRLEKEQQDFETLLTTNNLYTSRLLRIHNILDSYINNLNIAGPEQITITRNFILDNLDINSLYTSNLWFTVINGLLPVYIEGTPYHDQFINDMSVLLNKTSSERVYSGMASDLFKICNALHWTKQEQQLASFLLNGRRINQPEGKLKTLFNLFKLEKGDKAPALSQGKLPAKNTILFFYESGCHNCDAQITQFIENYPQIVKKGFEVVSVSADTNKSIFEKNSKKFPWKDKYCDYLGINGKDFINYGISGTPSIYVTDKKGVITGRYARLEDINLK